LDLEKKAKLDFCPLLYTKNRKRERKEERKKRKREREKEKKEIKIEKKWKERIQLFYCNPFS
jgi:hypothetical protein